MLVHYSQEWAESFSRERALLLRALEPWLAANVEHVGSTSVPGMSAKPVIDMLAGVSDLQEARRAAGPCWSWTTTTDRTARRHTCSKSRTWVTGGARPITCT